MEKRRPLWRRLEPASAVLALLCVAWTIPLLLSAPLSPEAYLRAGALSKERLWEGEAWRLAASLFIHGGWLHLALNSISLYLVGSYVARAAGKRAFFFFVVVTAAGAHAAGLLWTRPDNLGMVRVGISGALAGLLGEILAAEWCFRRGLRGFFRSSTVWIVVFFLVLNAYLGSVIRGVDNAAHAGGFVTGLLVGLVFYRGGKKRTVPALVVAFVIAGLPLYYAAAPWDSERYQYFRARAALRTRDAGDSV